MKYGVCIVRINGAVTNLECTVCTLVICFESVEWVSRVGKKNETSKKKIIKKKKLKKVSRNAFETNL